MQRNILIADDHTIIRSGLMMMVRTTLGYPNAKAVASCAQIMEELSGTRYTHCILDITLPDGLVLSLLPVIRRLYPGIRVAIFSMQPQEIYQQAVRHHGVEYYISKSASDEESLSLLSKFLNNETLKCAATSEPPKSPFSRLSGRELQVLHYTLQGLRPADICNVMNKCKQTIATYRSRIYEKTGATNDRQLVEMAMAHGFS